MKAVIIGEKDKTDWENFVYENPNTIAWQSHEWSDVLKRHYRFVFFPIAAYRGNDICGILPLYHIKTRLSGDSLISVPYAVAGGITANDPDVRTALLEKAIEISKKHGSCPITLKQYKLKIDGDLALDDNYYNRELELSTDVTEVWRQFSEKNKEAIRQTEGLNFVMEYPSTELERFYDLLLKDLRAKGVPCVSKRWIQDLLAFKMYSIAILRVGGLIVAGTLVKKFKDTVSFPFTCFMDRNATKWVHRLYWELIQHFCMEGKRIFHSGRIPMNDATDQYRIGWGGTKYGYYYQYFPMRHVKTEFSVKRGRKRELAEKAWKTMPIMLARLIGPQVVKHFP
jgi:hypothetical protein